MEGGSSLDSSLACRILSKLLDWHFKTVIVNSRFLERPQKRNRGNQLIHRRLSKIKSIGSGSAPESQSSRQADNQMAVVDGFLRVETGREVGRRGQIRKGVYFKQMEKK